MLEGIIGLRGMSKVFINSIHVQTAKKHDATTKNRLKEGFLFIMLKNGQTYFKNLVVFSP